MWEIYVSCVSHEICVGQLGDRFTMRGNVSVIRQIFHIVPAISDSYFRSVLNGSAGTCHNVPDLLTRRSRFASMGIIQLSDFR
jgi:hypothetical protein